MLRSEAARYARWSASIALLLAGITMVVYLQRGWVLHREKKKAPPPAPVEVSRQSNGINFKKVDQNRTIFEISASRSTEFKGKQDNLLEDVEITIFGKTGERHDVIHTRSCQYGKETGSILCNGEVQISLMSAEDAARTANDPAAAKAVTTHVQTHGVHFDRSTGVAQSDEHVSFEFPSGHGDALGLEYRSQEGALELRQNVRMTLIPSVTSAKDKKPVRNVATPEVHVTGTRLDFARNTRVMHLQGPAEAETPTQGLTAGEMTLLMDQAFRAEKLVAAAGEGTRPTVTSRGTSGQTTLQADTLTANLSAEGFLTKIEAQGSVHGLRIAAGEQDEAVADSGTMELWPRLNQLKELNLVGNVVLKTQANQPGNSRTLRTSAFRMQFSGGEAGAANKAQKGETLAAGTMEWTEVVQPGGNQANTKLSADKLEMVFAGDGKARQLTCTNNVRSEREITGRPTQTATARNAVIELQPTGGWSEMQLRGGVQLKEADRTGEGDNALFVRESQIAVLTGNALARDASTQTRAPKITFFQSTGDIFAEGGVRSTDLSATSSAVQLAPAPAHITSESLQANSKTGRALYTGHARLWQGDSVLEADSIELLRPLRILNAIGNVRGVFPQQAATLSNNASGESAQPSTLSVSTTSTTQGLSKKTHLWHVSSGALAYYDLEGRARLEKNVVVQSPDQRMQSPFQDLYFTRNAQTGRNATNPSGSLVGAQQISRAVGSGGVVVEQGGRKATAQDGEYVATTGKFVMSGGNPTIYDGSAGTTTGRQLTFFLADDTIIVDSENGSRTLTKHRVEK